MMPGMGLLNVIPTEKNTKKQGTEHIQNFIEFRELKNIISKFIRKINLENYRPDLILSNNRGGLILGVMLSHYLELSNVPVTFRLHKEPKIVEFNTLLPKQLIKDKKKILFVDDINNTGETLETVKKYFYEVVKDDISKEDFDNNIWLNQFKIFVLVNNTFSKEKVNYFGIDANLRREKYNFEWEKWWLTF